MKQLALAAVLPAAMPALVLANQPADLANRGHARDRYPLLDHSCDSREMDQGKAWKKPKNQWRCRSETRPPVRPGMSFPQPEPSRAHHH